MTSNVSDLLRDAASRRPDGVALVEDRGVRRELTWADFDAAADAVARGLSGRGLRAGQRVALVMVNRIDLAIAYFGVLRGGMVAVPVNPRSPSGDVARIVGESGARLVLSDETGIGAVRAAIDAGDLEDLGVVVDEARPRSGETAFSAFLDEASASEPIAPRDPESRAVLLDTVGADGSHRGAILTHRALLANIEQVASLDPAPVAEGEVVLGLLPLYHVYGLNVVLGQAVRHGATVVMVDGFRPDALLRTIVDESVTNVPLAPPVVAAWAGRDDLRDALAGVRTVVSGASMLDPALAAAFHESSGHHVEQGYGHTEAAPVITLSLVGLADRPAGQGPRPGTFGRPVPGVEVRIVEEGGRDAEPGDPGEVWVRGDNLFSGYWPDGSDGTDPDGWYATGDVGYLDDEGELVVLDKLSELVVVSGFSVYPSEVEDLVGDVDGIVEAAVVGVPDEQTGQSVVAFVVAEETLDDDEVVHRVEQAARSALARFKQPNRVVVVHDLPQSPSGGVAKGRLRAMARSEVLGLDATSA